MSFQHSDPLADRDAPPRALVEALRQEPIDPMQIQNAYVRFLQKRTAAPVWWRARGVARWAAFAVVLGVSTVYAATLIRPFASSDELKPSVVPSVLPTEAPRAPKLRAHPAKPPEAPAQEEAGEPSPEETAVEAGSAHEVDAASPNTTREQSLRSPAPIPSAEQWKRAARGLRDGDFQSANAALKELTRRGTEADRESAQLVQAQLLLAQGREAEASGLLRSLEASAHAPSVRRKSTELLARLRDKPASRAAKSRAGNEQP